MFAIMCSEAANILKFPTEGSTKEISYLKVGGQILNLEDVRIGKVQCFIFGLTYDG